MSLTALVLLLIVAGVCGAIGRSLGGHTKGGVLVSIGVGFVGATLGLWMADKFGLPEMFMVEIGGNRIPIAWSIIGSALFVAVLSMIAKNR